MEEGAQETSYEYKPKMNAKRRRGGDNHCKDYVCLGVGEYGNYNSTTLSTLQLFGLENILDLLIQKPICSWNGVPPLKASFLGLQ